MCIKLKVSFLAIIWLLTLMYFIYQRVNKGKALQLVIMYYLYFI